MLEQATLWLAWVDLVLLMVAVVLGSVLFRKLQTNLKILLLYLLAVLVIEIIAKIYLRILERDNIFLLHFYTLFEFLGLTLYFRETLVLPGRIKRYILIFIIVVAIILVLYSTNILFWHTEKLQPLQFDLYQKILTHLVILCLAVFSFIQFAQRTGLKHEKEMRSIFWLNAGILLYFSGSFVIFLAIRNLINLPFGEGIMLWLINAFLTFILYLTVINVFINRYYAWKRMWY